MAEIFRATIGPDPGTYAFDLAVKRMAGTSADKSGDRTPDKELVDRFLTEADIAKFLKHQNLIQVYESGLISGRPYIAMEYVWGLDVARLMSMLRGRRSRFSVDHAVFFAMQVLRGLDYVHRAMAPGGAPMNLVHRDITPENLYVTFRGEAKFGDFGIAHVSFLEGHERGGTLLGKARYMSPELLRGEKPQQRDDLWSLGISLVEMLTGSPPFADKTDEELQRGEGISGAAALAPLRHELDPGLLAVLTKTLHPRPKRRFQGSADLYRELKQLLRTTSPATDASTLARFVRAATGVSEALPEPITQPSGGNFSDPGYQAPVGQSITVRFTLAQKRRRLWPWLALGIGIAALVGVVLERLL